MSSVPFGARPCRAMRAKILAQGPTVLPRSWQRTWMIARIIQTPPWVNFSEVREVYRWAAELTRTTGVSHTVDHIVPLNHPMVSGLHVPCNLRPVPASVNFSKGNTWMPDQIEMWGDVPEQLRLF